MTHYGFEQWIDFARGVAPEALTRDMDEHLRVGCADCAHELATWKSIYNFAATESLCEPPADLVRIVKSAVAPPASRTVSARIAEMAQLVFDSFAQPQLQGVRSAQATARQLLYKAGPLLIDMQLQSLREFLAALADRPGDQRGPIGKRNGCAARPSYERPQRACAHSYGPLW